MRPFYLHLERFSRLILLVFFFASFCSYAQGQSIGRLEQIRSNIGSYYYFATPGSATIRVHLLGTVRSPGLYEIEAGTSLGELLSLSGGPLLPSRRQSGRNEVILRLYRQHYPSPSLQIETKLDAALADSASYPCVLQEGDILSIEVIEKGGFDWRDGFTVANTVFWFALTLERLISLWR